MELRIVKTPQWHNKETNQVVSFISSTPFYNDKEKLKWELREMEAKEILIDGKVTYFECSYNKVDHTMEEVFKTFVKEYFHHEITKQIST